MHAFTRIYGGGGGGGGGGVFNKFSRWPRDFVGEFYFSRVGIMSGRHHASILLMWKHTCTEFVPCAQHRSEQFLAETDGLRLIIIIIIIIICRKFPA